VLHGEPQQPGSVRPVHRGPPLGAVTHVRRAETLRRRGVGDPAAELAAEAGTAVFKVAFVRWIGRTGDRTLGSFLREALTELRAVTAEASER